MKIIIEYLGPRFQNSFTNVIEIDEGQLKRVPNHVLALTVFLCANVLMQGFADVCLKILSYSSLLPKVPWRTDFLFLTAVSVLMGYRTFVAMRQQKFDVTRNSIELGMLVEIGLVIGDLQFVSTHIATMPSVLLMRLPFLILTSINIVVLFYVYQTLNLRRWWCPQF